MLEDSCTCMKRVLKRYVAGGIRGHSRPFSDGIRWHSGAFAGIRGHSATREPCILRVFITFRVPRKLRAQPNFKILNRFLEGGEFKSRSGQVTHGVFRTCVVHVSS